MRTKQQVQAIISRLEEEYPLAECSLQYEKDYELFCMSVNINRNNGSFCSRRSWNQQSYHLIERI